MTNAPLVSVILPTHNRARWVGRAVASVLAQTHRPIELIVVDDGSSDETAGVLERFGELVTVLRQPHSGTYAARNRALEQARGEFVAFIDSDDVWHPDRLAAQLPLFQRPATGLVFGDAIHVGPDGEPLPGRSCFSTTPPHRGRVTGHLACGDFIPTVTVLVRRSCLEEVGGFPTSHRLSGDYLTWFRIATRHELDYVDRPVADYTVHDAGISSDLGRALTTRIELFREELDQTTDPTLRATLERLVFNLGVHLALATVRGRARGIAHPWAIARRAMLCTASKQRAAGWTAALFLRQARVRTRRRLTPVKAAAQGQSS